MDARRKKLLFQSQHCGMKENDVLIGGFAERHIANLSEEQLDQFEALLEESDNDLFNWITGKDAVPAHLDHDLMAALIQFQADL